MSASGQKRMQREIVAAQGPVEAETDPYNQITADKRGRWTGGIAFCWWREGWRDVYDNTGF
jgi:hypothetical protein